MFYITRLYKYEKTVWLRQQHIWLLSSQQIFLLSQPNYDADNKSFVELTKLNMESIKNQNLVGIINSFC